VRRHILPQAIPRAKAREARCDRLGLREIVPDRGLRRTPASLSRKRRCRRLAERVSEHEREHRGRCLTDLGTGEPGGLVDREAVIVVARLATGDARA
jgi:hypothetical protein